MSVLTPTEVKKLKEDALVALLERELGEVRAYLSVQLDIDRENQPHCSNCRDWWTDSAEARVQFVEELLDRFPILREAE